MTVRRLGCLAPSARPDRGREPAGVSRRPAVLLYFPLLDCTLFTVALRLCDNAKALSSFYRFPCECYFDVAVSFCNKEARTAAV